MNEKIKKIKISLREQLNPIFAPLRRIGVDTSFSIISNNCWGGHVYRYFGLNYSSPTVGMYFFADDYIRFLKDLKRYLCLQLTIIPLKDSKYKDILIRKGQTSVPIGKLGDVEIVFLHYKTPEEALSKWERRAKRVNYNNLVIKFSEMNLCNDEHLREFDALPYKKKIVFVTRKRGLKSEILFKGYDGQSEIKDDTTYFRKYVNLRRLISR